MKAENCIRCTSPLDLLDLLCVSPGYEGLCDNCKGFKYCEDNCKDGKHEKYCVVQP